MSEGWGDALSCARCGHPSGYHGVTFCQVDAGSVNKRRCDCPGWRARRPTPLVPVVTPAPGIETGSYTVRCTCPPNRGDNYFGTCPIHDVRVTA